MFHLALPSITNTCRVRESLKRTSIPFRGKFLSGRQRNEPGEAGHAKNCSCSWNRCCAHRVGIDSRVVVHRPQSISRTDPGTTRAATRKEGHIGQNEPGVATASFPGPGYRHCRRPQPWTTVTLYSSGKSGRSDQPSFAADGRPDNPFAGTPASKRGIDKEQDWTVEFLEPGSRQR